MQGREPLRETPDTEQIMIPLKDTEFAARYDDILARVREKITCAFPDVDMPETDSEISGIYVRGSMFIVTWDPLDDFDCGEAGLDIYLLDVSEREFGGYLLDLEVYVSRFNEYGELSC